MINIPSQHDIKNLLEQQSGTCITITLSTHRTGAEKQADALKLRHAIREVEHQLGTASPHAPDTKILFKQMKNLLEDNQFWQQVNNGLVILRSASLFQVYHLPISVRDHVFVGNHFYLKPLLPFLTGNKHFYILAFSQNEIRLLKASRFNIQEVELPEQVPENLDLALNETGADNPVRYHSSSTGAQVGKAGRRAVIFHGQGIGTDDNKDKLLRYFRQIDRGLHELLHDKTEPLVLAGVAYLLNIYAEANTYPHLLEQGIAGNPDRLQPESLHEQAWSLIEPLSMKPQKEATIRYEEASGSGLASHSLREVLPAAFQGRIESLFVALDRERWGSFSPETNKVTIHENPEPGDEDLLDIVARQTLLHNGKIYAVAQVAIPEKTEVAAVFRY